MPHETPSQEPTFGYLSTIQSPEHGYFGGYLVVSPHGRPLEFHCTSPVQPSRAQQILYGPTLQPYLLGEQLGGALLEAARIQPRLILTDHAATMAVRPRIAIPMAHLLTEIGSDADGASTSRDAVNPSSSGHSQFSIGQYHLQLPPGFESDQQTVIELLAMLLPHVELAEPFERIAEAIREAQRIGERAPESHGQAA